MSLIASFSRLSLVNNLLTRCVVTQTIAGERHKHVKFADLDKPKPGSLKIVKFVKIFNEK